MSGRNAPRSKSGCQTCRQRKVKCDEARPVCNRCGRLKLGCEWGLSSKRGSKSIQVRNVNFTARNRQWYLSSLWRHYGDSSKSWTGKEFLQQSSYGETGPWLWRQDLQYPIVSRPAFPMTDTSLPQYNLYATTLTNPEISCANALTLTVADQNYFRFFPSSSVVFYYMKPWEWSSFGFIYQGPAAANKLIMRMILALAASDMHRRGLISDVASHEAARNHGRYHYELAVRDLREYLEHGTSNETGEGGASESEFEMIFCTMFLMISFEWHYGHSVKHLQLHLQGVRCLLKAHPEMFLLKDMTNRILTTGSNPKGGLSFMPAQFLLWILYMEIAGHHRGLEGSLYDTLLDSGNSSLHPDYLHQSARIWGRCLWGEEYPDNQILDDMENHRALELLHHAMIMRNKIWQLALGNSERSVTSTPETLFSEMMTIRDTFSDVFITAKFTSSLSARRALYTIYFAVCTFDAQILYHRRLLYPTSHARRTVHRQALASMLEILYRQYSIDPILLQRMPWSIFMVMIETEDPIHRDWAEQRLREVRHVHEDYGFINILVDEFIDRQRARPGKMVNLFEILQRQYSMYNK